MYLCPRCNQALFQATEPAGISWVCQICGGRALESGRLRQALGEPETARVLNEAPGQEESPKIGCPKCSQAMTSTQAAMLGGKRLSIEVCRPCGLAWFDAGELPFTPPPATPALAGSTRTQEDIDAASFLEAQKMLAVERKEHPAIYEDWKTIPGFLGLPIELDSIKATGTPWTTYLTATVITATSLAAFGDLSAAVARFGLIPGEVWRDFGLTLLTSFFIHAGALHLLGNIWFLVVFGRAVERDLGAARWLSLLVVATITGGLLDVVFDPRSTVPLVGASGGISGILAYYALRDPGATLGIPIRFGGYISWMDLPAWLCFFFWIGLQIVGAARQVDGFGEVAALAHLGGAVAGLFFWLAYRGQAATETSAK